MQFLVNPCFSSSFLLSTSPTKPHAKAKPEAPGVPEATVEAAAAAPAPSAPSSPLFDLVRKVPEVTAQDG